MASFSQCSTAQKLQKEPPMAFGEVYAQKWVAGIEGGGSGIDVFVPIEESSITLDSMFFRKQKVKLEFIDGDNPMYVGRFKTLVNQSENLVLSSDMNEETKNTLPQPAEDMPFDIEDNACVISYKKGNRTLYYKIADIAMKQQLHYPSAPKNGQ